MFYFRLTRGKFILIFMTWRWQKRLTNDNDSDNGDPAQHSPQQARLIGVGTKSKCLLHLGNLRCSVPVWSTGGEEKQVELFPRPCCISETIGYVSL